MQYKRTTRPGDQSAELTMSVVKTSMSDQEILAFQKEIRRVDGFIKSSEDILAQEVSRLANPTPFTAQDIQDSIDYTKGNRDYWVSARNARVLSLVLDQHHELITTYFGRQDPVLRALDAKLTPPLK
jgi:hypothetical protein